jgi:hypothetical protein
VWSVESVSSSGEEVPVSAARSATSAIVLGERYGCAGKKAFTRDTQSFETPLGGSSQSSIPCLATALGLDFRMSAYEEEAGCVASPE